MRWPWEQPPPPPPPPPEEAIDAHVVAACLAIGAALLLTVLVARRMLGVALAKAGMFNTLSVIGRTRAKRRWKVAREIPCGILLARGKTLTAVALQHGILAAAKKKKQEESPHVPLKYPKFERWVGGTWKQVRVENDKFDEILRKARLPYLIRKALLKIDIDLKYVVLEDGELGVKLRMCNGMVVTEMALPGESELVALGISNKSSNVLKDDGSAVTYGSITYGSTVITNDETHFILQGEGAETELVIDTRGDNGSYKRFFRRDASA